MAFPLIAFIFTLVIAMLRRQWRHPGIRRATVAVMVATGRAAQKSVVLRDAGVFARMVVAAAPGLMRLDRSTFSMTGAGPGGPA